MFSDLPASSLSQITSVPFLEVTVSAVRKLGESGHKPLKSNTVNSSDIMTTSVPTRLQHFLCHYPATQL